MMKISPRQHPNTRPVPWEVYKKKSVSCSAQKKKNLTQFGRWNKNQVTSALRGIIKC